MTDKKHNVQVHEMVGARTILRPEWYTVFEDGDTYNVYPEDAATAYMGALECSNADLRGEVERLKENLRFHSVSVASFNEVLDSYKVLQSELASLCSSESAWVEIKEGCVPTAGDQLLALDPDGKVFDLQIVSSRMPGNWIWSDYIADWFTHFRPMNAPIPKSKRAANGDPDTIVPAPAPHKKHPGYAK